MVVFQVELAPAVISIPPLVAVKTAAEVPLFVVAILISPVVSASIPPVPELISIPPAVLEAFKNIAFA